MLGKYQEHTATRQVKRSLFSLSLSLSIYIPDSKSSHCRINGILFCRLRANCTASLVTTGLAPCRLRTPPNQNQQTCITLLQDHTADLSQVGHVSPVHCVPLTTNWTGRNGGRKKSCRKKSCRKKIGSSLPKKDNHTEAGGR